jgi:hypothetical protein
MGWTADDLKRYTQRRLKDEERARAKIRGNHETPDPLAGLPNPDREPQARPLVSKPRRKATRRRSPVVRITIVSVRHRLLDSDNLVAGCKQIRDALAEKLESSDAEGSGIEWETEQVLTRGTEGTLVRIECLDRENENT